MRTVYIYRGNCGDLGRIGDISKKKKTEPQIANLKLRTKVSNIKPNIKPPRSDNEAKSHQSDMEGVL